MFPMCKNCEYFAPNGDTRTEGGTFFPSYKIKMGDCTNEIEPPCGRLKNEQNGCDNFKEKSNEKIL